MDVVPADAALEDLDLQLRADVPHVPPQPDADVAAEQYLAVLGDPHEVELQVEASVGGPSITLHPGNVLGVVA